MWESRCAAEGGADSCGQQRALGCTGTEQDPDTARGPEPQPRLVAVTLWRWWPSPWDCCPHSVVRVRAACWPQAAQGRTSRQENKSLETARLGASWGSSEPRPVPAGCLLRPPLSWQSLLCQGLFLT